ncbi:MAG: IS3 family transposase, partial [Gammaproteobacteria bacterium]|nr:IS3 family transposase [Gammaproteobacteria bacterium]
KDGERDFKKGDGLLCQRNDVKYAFITQHKKTWPINPMCRVLGVHRQGYYRYCSRQALQTKDPKHQAQLTLVKELAQASGDSYGSRRMSAALSVLSEPVGRDKARSLMKEADVCVKQRKKYKATTNSNHKKPIYSNVLNREFSVRNPDQAYVGDITYLWTQEGWLYLAVVIDLYSRKIVGWSMSSRMTATLVCDALTMAIWQRHPKAGLIVHSDRGSQYASDRYRQLVSKYGFVGSMSRKGNCWDNAVAESFFGSLKQERVRWRHYQTRYEAQQDVLNYITLFYNDGRLHSTLGYQSPNQFEAQAVKLKNAS